MDHWCRDQVRAGTPDRSLIQVDETHTLTPHAHAVSFFLFFLSRLRSAWVMRTTFAFIIRRVLAGADHSSSDMCPPPGEVRDHLTYPHPQERLWTIDDPNTMQD